jgi:hypothetical protein
MTVEALTRSGADELPPELRRAQDALQFPEVQDMLRKLSAYNLGICMPHMHDEKTGGFQVLPADRVQVESGLQVSFHADAEVDNPDRYVPVAWVWHDDGIRAASRCVSKCAKNPGSSMHTSGHHTEDDKK